MPDPMRRKVNMACKQYLKARYGHKPRKELMDIKRKIKRQLRAATEDRQDQFVEDVRNLLTRSNVVVVF